MIREVDLVSYLPPFLAEFNENTAALKAENPEFKLVWEAADRVLKNEFIATADEYGISRFEKHLGIFPSRKETLEDRRLRVQMRWFILLPYTVRMLAEKLVQSFGEGNFTLTVDHMHYSVKVEISSDQHGQKPELKRLLYAMVPCNMIIGIIETVYLIVVHEEHFATPNIDIYAAMPFFHSLYFDGSVYLDGSEYMNAETSYNLVPHIFIGGYKLPIDNTAEMRGLTICTKTVQDESLAARTADAAVPMDYWGRKGKTESVEVDSKASIDAVIPIKNKDEGMNLSILSERDPVFFNGDYYLDGKKKLNSVYLKEEVQ